MKKSFNRKSFKSLEFKDLDVSMGAEESALNGVSLTLPTHEIIWVKSDSPVSRSSLLRTLMAQAQVNSGDYLVNGESVLEMTFEEFLPYKINMGYSFDFGGLINNRTLRQNLSLPLEYHSSSHEFDVDQKVSQYLDCFEISEKEAELRPFMNLGSVRKAICVARAFMLEPEMLLLDDPTTGLKGHLKEKLKKHLMSGFERGVYKHIVVGTEDEGFMSDIAHSVLSLKEGKVESQVDLNKNLKKSGEQVA